MCVFVYDHDVSPATRNSHPAAIKPGLLVLIMIRRGRVALRLIIKFKFTTSESRRRLGVRWRGAAESHKLPDPAGLSPRSEETVTIGTTPRFIT